MLSLRNLVGVATLGAALASSASAAISWDILDRNYGNGAGEVAFNSVENFFWGSVAPSEATSAGKTTLTLPQNGGLTYAGNSTIAGMVSGNADVTLEIKVATPQNTPFLAFLSETNNNGTSSWNHILLVNRTYDTSPMANAVADYNARDNVNSAPPGFDGTLPHVYRLVREGGVTSLYLDDNPTALVSPVISSAGAAGDGLNYEFGLAHDPSVAATIDMYYFKIASGAHAPVPEPASMSLLAIATVLLGRRAR